MPRPTATNLHSAPVSISHSNRRAFIVLATAAFAYLFAVMQRSSMGVSALEASDRFSVTAAQLSTLAVLQLVVYAGMQVPVGLLLDRFGSRRLLAFGALAMAAGQIVVASSDVIGQAVVGRMLVGLGDAFTFISMIRLIHHWFDGRVAGQVQQWLANFGQLGQILSAVPFAWLLGLVGWNSAFLTLGAVSAIVCIAVFLLVIDARDASGNPEVTMSGRAAISQLREHVRNPGIRMAFWTHFSTQSMGTMFVLLWGMPFLIRAQGLEHSVAAGLLSLFVVVAIVVGPLIGWLGARHPYRRSNLVITIVAVMLMAWALLLSWSGPAPLWLLVLAVVTIAAGGPASMIAFDFSRTFAAKKVLGSANGFVNIGGFLASFIMMLLIGLALDLTHFVRESMSITSDLFDLDNFRWAFLVPFLVVGGGLLMFLRERRLARVDLERDSGIKLEHFGVVLARKYATKRSKQK